LALAVHWWWSGIAVARWSRSMKLAYVGPS